MSAWRIGRDAAAPQVETKGPSDGKNFIDNIVKYIPGDTIVGYTTAITLFALQGGEPNPQMWLAIAFVGITAALVFLGWLASPAAERGGVGNVLPDVVLGMVAFIVWSLSVPGNGWNEISLVASNPPVAAVVGVIAGILLPPIAKVLGRN